MTQSGEVQPAGSENPPEEDGKHPERPSPFAVTGLIAGICAAVAAVLLLDTFPRISAVLLISVGLTLVVLWAFTRVRESRWFRVATTALLAAALIGTGGVVFFVPVKRTAPSPSPTITVTAKPTPTHGAHSSAPVQLGPITSPVDGDQVGPYVNLRGSVSGLNPGQMVWTFFEPFTGRGRPTGAYYPDRGPCPVVGQAWACDHIGLGYTGTASKSSIGQYIIWAVVVNSQEAFNIVSTIRCLASPSIVPACPYSVATLPGTENAPAQHVRVTRIR